MHKGTLTKEHCACFLSESGFSGEKGLNFLVRTISVRLSKGPVGSSIEVIHGPDLYQNASSLVFFVSRVCSTYRE